jgi:hypothetical protein
MSPGSVCDPGAASAAAHRPVLGVGLIRVKPCARRLDDGDPLTCGYGN